MYTQLHAPYSVCMLATLGQLLAISGKLAVTTSSFALSTLETDNKHCAVQTVPQQRNTIHLPSCMPHNLYIHFTFGVNPTTTGKSSLTHWFSSVF